MGTEIIQAIQNIGIEAIKILGPAIIASVVAYKIGKSQMYGHIGVRPTQLTSLHFKIFHNHAFHKDFACEGGVNSF